MSSIAEIIEAAQSLDPAEFMQLRNALDEFEEKLWAQELSRVTAKHRRGKLTDAKIDQLVLKRRRTGAQS